MVKKVEKFDVESWNKFVSTHLGLRSLSLAMVNYTMGEFTTPLIPSRLYKFAVHIPMGDAEQLFTTVIVDHEQLHTLHWFAPAGTALFESLLCDVVNLRKVSVRSVERDVGIDLLTTVGQVLSLEVFDIDEGIPEKVAKRLLPALSDGVTKVPQWCFTKTRIDTVAKRLTHVSNLVLPSRAISQEVLAVIGANLHLSSLTLFAIAGCAEHCGELVPACAELQELTVHGIGGSLALEPIIVAAARSPRLTSLTFIQRPMTLADEKALETLVLRFGMEWRGGVLRYLSLSADNPRVRRHLLAAKDEGRLAVYDFVPWAANGDSAADFAKLLHPSTTDKQVVWDGLAALEASMS